VFLHDAFGDGESKAAAVPCAGFVYGVEAAEDALPIFGRKGSAHAVCAQNCVSALGIQSEQGFRVGVGIFDGIIQQNVRDLRQMGRAACEQNVLIAFFAPSKMGRRMRAVQVFC